MSQAVDDFVYTPVVEKAHKKADKQRQMEIDALAARREEEDKLLNAGWEQFVPSKNFHMGLLEPLAWLNLVRGALLVSLVLFLMMVPVSLGIHFLVYPRNDVFRIIGAGFLAFGDFWLFLVGTAFFFGSFGENAISAELTKKYKRVTSHRKGGYWLYSGAIPVKAWKQYNRSKKFFDYVVVATPDKELLTHTTVRPLGGRLAPITRKLKQLDPMLIGVRDRNTQTPQFYVGASWELEKDIHIISQREASF